jgi:hypothetical protein
MLLVAGAALLLVGSIWLFARDPILEHWADHYGNWRDAYLIARLRDAPQFFLGLGGLFLFAGVAVRLFGDRVGLAEARGETWHEALLGTSIIAGALLSLREWARYGYPCWDMYCDRAAMWATWVAQPSSANFEAIVGGISAHHTGNSVLPSLLIGALAAPGVSVLLVYQLLVALAWVGVAWTMVYIGRRYLGHDRHTTLVMCVLLFGHLAVMRSLIFPQTDPLSLLAMLLVVAFSMGLEHNGLRGRLSLYFLLLVGFFTKLSFVPSFAAPALEWAFPTSGERADLRAGALRIVGLVAFPLASCAVLLVAFGFVDMLTRELSWVYDAGGNFEKDNNGLRFIVATTTTVQLLPLVLWAAPEPWTGARRQLAWMSLLVLLGLVVMKTAFWSRYMLPINCMLTLLVASSVTRVLGRGTTSIVCLTLYVAGNALFLMSNLYA